MLRQPWRIELLNGLRAVRGEEAVTRFRTQKTALLLAYLAYQMPRRPFREEIAGVLWPDSDPEAGRASLRTAAASLRRQLEPPGTPANSVLIADRLTMGLNPVAVSTDVAGFISAVRALAQAGAPASSLARHLDAIDNYPGAFLPGFYEDWVLTERNMLAQLYRETLRRVADTLIQAGETERALVYAERLVVTDPWNDEAQLLLMRLYDSAGRKSEALWCFEELEHRMLEGLGEPPSDRVRSFARQLRAEAGLTSATPAVAHDSVSPAISYHLSRAASERAPHRPISRQPTLPLPLTRFFGRETEIMDVCRMLQQPEHGRLVTLTGLGGAGKTRLAIEIADRLGTAHPEAIAFVALSETADPNLVRAAIAQALMLAPYAEDELLDRIVAAVSSRPTLLVLDNFEQLLDSSDCPSQTRAAVEDGAVTIHTLLKRAPSLRCLVTSRRELNVDGERIYIVRPLATPRTPGTPDRLVEFASVQLFIDRAQAPQPDFTLTDYNSATVAAICDKLEGIPLAIELAAAWASILSPQEILSRLSDRFALLTSRRRGIEPRHSSLGAALEGSLDLLTASLRDLFAHLAVFHGTWTVEAAKAVCGGPHVIGSLRALKGRSLIWIEHIDGSADGEHGYRLLDTVREFAWEQNSETVRTDLIRRHSEYYTRFAESAAAHMAGSSQVLWLDRLEAVYENMRAVLRRSSEPGGDPEIGLRLAGALYQFWSVRGHYVEGRSFLDKLLRKTDLLDPAPYHAAALRAAASLATYARDWNAARGYHGRHLAAERVLGNDRGAAQALIGLGEMAQMRDDTLEALACFAASAELYEGLGNELGVASARGSMGGVAAASGDFDEAIRQFQHVVAIQRKYVNASGLAFWLQELGVVFLKRGRGEEARRCFLESLEWYEKLSDVRGAAEFLDRLSGLVEISTVSAQLSGAAESLMARTTAAPLPNADKRKRLREALGPSTFEWAISEGRALTVEQAIGAARKALSRDWAEPRLQF